MTSISSVSQMDSSDEPRLSPDELKEFLNNFSNAGEMHEFPANETLISPGVIDSTVYIIFEGEVKVFIPLSDEWIPVALLTAGSVIGDMAFFSGNPRNALVKTELPCKVFSLTRESFDKFSLENPSVAKSFIWRLGRIVVHRLRRVEMFDAAELGREEERKRLAAELHDDTMNDLASFIMNIGIMKLEFSKKYPEIIPELNELVQRIKDTDRKLRDIVKGIFPPTLDNSGLVSALNADFNDMASKVNESRLNLKFKTQGFKNTRLSKPIEVDLYRIVNQALVNAIKHSQAKNILVELIWAEKEVKFLIQDDGIGFDQDKISNKLSAGHFGLSGLKLRAERMLGTLDIDSKIGSGTKMYGAIPISSKDSSDIEVITLDYNI
ncbi:MAG: hypothetical protein CL758_03790 [Chloroflexi bacterium]|nr:hypothetical protein [Chloroflexota bacterium]